MSTGGPPVTMPLPTTTPKLNNPSSLPLTSHQTQLLTSLLSLFTGHCSPAQLSYWSPDAVFADPLTEARGHKQYAAQWYGLANAFSKTEMLDNRVTGVGNPMTLDLKMQYRVKGMPKDTEIKSEVRCWVDGEGKIERVEDRWEGNIPEGAIAKAFQRLNAVVVPKFVSIPKDEEQNTKKD